MNESVVMLITFAVLIIFVGAYENHGRKKRYYHRIASQFGKKPEKKSKDFELISLYWNEMRQSDQECLIDDETWNDLDLEDVFHRINATCSFAGEEYFYAVLRTLSQDIGRFEDYEKKLEYLRKHEEERKFIQLQLAKIGKRPSSYYLPVLFGNLPAFGISNYWFYRIMQILLMGSIVFAVFTQSVQSLIAIAVIFVANFIIYNTMKGKYEIHLEVMSGLYGMMKAVRKIKSDKKETFGYAFPELGEVQDSLKYTEKYFKFILGRSASNAGGDFMEIAATYITGALLLDFTIYNRVLHCLKERQREFQRLFELVGELDMLIAVASFRESLPLHCVPDFGNDSCLIMEDVYHPLIDKPVYNSVSLEKNTIITGSNASGKSTFIKAAAINEILAQTIHTCTARSMTLPFAFVKTSMAVKDNPMDGESYYMKEIKSLKRTVSSMNARVPVLCAIDEILRGTNTNERIAASAAILKYLKQQNCIVIVATHDLELLSLLQEEGYDFYYFSEQPDNGDVLFDYTIRKGRSRETNAIKMLQRIGFPKDITDEANQVYRELAKL